MRDPCRPSTAGCLELVCLAQGKVILAGSTFRRALGSMQWDVINTALKWLGLADEPVHLLNNLVGVEIGLIHALLPLMVLSLVVAIQSIDYEIELAAANLGATPTRVFLRVIMPLSRPGLISGSVLVFTVATSAYTTPVMLGGNRVLVMSTFLAKEMLSVLNYAFAATCAVILVITSVLLGAVVLRNSERYGAA